MSTIAHMAKFIIADFTNPKIVLHEAPDLVKALPVPFVPLLKEGKREPVTLSDLRIGRTTILETVRYKETEDLLESFYEKAILPAEKLKKELEKA